MKAKNVARVCKAVIIAALVALYCIVGGMEHFRIELGVGILACLGCFAAAGLAAFIGCMER